MKNIIKVLILSFSLLSANISFAQVDWVPFGFFDFTGGLNNNFDSSSPETMVLFNKYVDVNNHFTLLLAGSDNDYDHNGKIYFKIEMSLSS